MVSDDIFFWQKKKWKKWVDMPSSHLWHYLIRIIRLSYAASELPIIFGAIVLYIVSRYFSSTTASAAAS